MKTLIYYFSGTGNSLFVAKKLQEEIVDSDIVPIVRALKNPKKVIQADTAVIVFPIYALTIPLPVRQFLKEFNWDEVKYISAIATRLGTYFNDFQRIDKLLSPGKLSSHFIINMGSNDVKVKDYKCPSENQIEKLELTALKTVKDASQIIQSREIYRESDTDYIDALPFGDLRDKLTWWLIPKLMTFSKLIGGVNYFYTNEKCNGCGICDKVCLSGKISMDDGKPLWSKKILCHMCYACINFCPMQAIEIASIPGVDSYSHENGRYSHLYATVKDICHQKL